MTRVLIMATNGFEQSELTGPRDRLEQAGIETRIASPEAGEIRGWQDKDWGETVAVDLTLEQVEVEDYDALLLPGGQINPDLLRMDDRAIAVVSHFAEAGKTIAAICHAPWLLAEAGLVSGGGMTREAALGKLFGLLGAGLPAAEVERLFALDLCGELAE